MDRSPLAAMLAALILAACGDQTSPATAPASPSAGSEQAPALVPVPPLDYAQPASWLCGSGPDQSCWSDVGVTSIAADGAQLRHGANIIAGDPLVDCFYVYPTISRDPGGNSDATPGPEEQEVMRQQLAPFAPHCRLFAPVYRQATLTALRKLRAGEQVETNREMAYADVRAAWRHYLAADNAGRGFVLIGHNQGAGLLTRLIAAEIDGKPEQGRLISAILPGADIEVPQDADVGGSFATVPLCAAPSSIGCVIAWSAFRSESPPPADTLFGRAATTGMRVACVNPAGLDDATDQIRAFLPVRPTLFDELADPAPWNTLADAPPIETPFVELPGLLSAQCINREGASYLAITVNADPADPRTDTINGDVIVGNAIRRQWGLHLIDMHLVMGNLISIASAQSAAWLQQHAARGLLPADLQ